MASLRELSRYQTAILTLPEYKPVLGFEDQKPLLIDDGKSSISTKLVGIRDLNQKKLRVGLKASTCSDKDMKLLEETFKLLNKDAKVLEGTCKLGKLDEQGKVTFQPVPHKEVYLPATSIKPDVGDGEFLVTFPSLRALKQQPIDDEAKVVVSIGDERNLVYKHCREYPGVYAVMQKPPLFALSVLAGVINSDEHGQGTVVIDIQKAPDSDTFPATVAVKISGADFNVCKVTTNPTGILLPKEKDPAPDPKVLKVTKPGTVTLALFNLNPESDVTVSGTDDSGTSSTPITVRVVSLSASKQKKQE